MTKEKKDVKTVKETKTFKPAPARFTGKSWGKNYRLLGKDKFIVEAVFDGKENELFSKEEALKEIKKF